jgi:thiol-disulfide isomerase/thioredoxin
MFSFSLFRRQHLLFLSGGFCLSLLASTLQAQVKVETVLSYKPAQQDIEYETPAPNEIDECKLEVERQGKGSGWILYGPQGQVLRRFLDTNGDRQVDEYRYFQHGIEVYRDIDTNRDNDVDQFRWLNTAGTRWGIDRTGDGKIDTWKRISAEEASREAILALASGDERRLAAVLISADDAKTLKLAEGVGKQLLDKVSNAGAKMREAASNDVIQRSTQWIRFDSSMLMPNLVPADPSKGEEDLLIYGNVMAIVETDGETGFVQIGEMVRVGETWKLTQIPRPLDGNQMEVADGGVLLQPPLAGSVTPSEGLSPRMRELIDELRSLDESAPGVDASREAMTRYNVARAELLAKLAAEAGSAEERSEWLRQRLEGVAAATQMETYPNGLEELKRAERQLRQSGTSQSLLAFAVFQRLLVEYNLELQKADAENRAQVQEDWLESLKSYVEEFPEVPESADAMLQLAITQEFNGNVPEARTWYGKLVSDYGSTQAAVRARGALRRLGLKGNRLELSGKSLTGGTIDVASYRGKVLAVVFWATWCKPCTEDLPQIQELYRRHKQDGFEVVGVNLDSPGAPIQQYIQNFRVEWPHLHEEGGLESRPAVDYGVISLPTMFVVDKNGTVVNAAATIDDLKSTVPELLRR